MLTNKSKKWLSAFLAILVAYQPMSLLAVEIRSPRLEWTAPSTIQMPVVPNDIAFVSGSHQSPLSNQPLIYLIQSPHTNESGEKNVSSILEGLVRENGVDLVFIEGADGNHSISGLRGLLPKNKRAVIAQRLLRRGEIDGPAYLDLTTSDDLRFLLWGVEEPGLYSQALEAYRNAAALRQQVLDYLKQIAVLTEFVKGLTYNLSLKAYDDSLLKLKSGETTLSEQIAFLLSKAEENGVGCGQYKNILQIHEIQKNEDTIDFSKAQIEHHRLVQSFSKEQAERWGLDQGTTRPDRIRERALYVETGYFARLKEATKDRRKEFPELFRYLDYLDMVKGLNISKILVERDALERDIYHRLIQSQKEYNLYELDQHRHLTRALISLSINSEEYERYLLNADKYSIINMTGFLNQVLMGDDRAPEKAVFMNTHAVDAEKNARTFYELAQRRDQAFIENSLKVMELSGRKKAALVVGGFHASHLEKLLSQKKCSYVTMMPQVTHETSINKYERLLLSGAAQDDIGLPLNDGVADKRTIAVYRQRYPSVAQEAGASWQFLRDERMILQTAFFGSLDPLRATSSSGSRTSAVATQVSLEVFESPDALSMAKTIRGKAAATSIKIRLGKTIHYIDDEIDDHIRNILASSFGASDIRDKIRLLFVLMEKSSKIESKEKAGRAIVSLAYNPGVSGTEARLFIWSTFMAKRDRQGDYPVVLEFFAENAQTDVLGKVLTDLRELFPKKKDDEASIDESKIRKAAYSLMNLLRRSNSASAPIILSAIGSTFNEASSPMTHLHLIEAVSEFEASLPVVPKDKLSEIISAMIAYAANKEEIPRPARMIVLLMLIALKDHSIEASDFLKKPGVATSFFDTQRPSPGMGLSDAVAAYINYLRSMMEAAVTHDLRERYDKIAQAHLIRETAYSRTGALPLINAMDEGAKLISPAAIDMGDRVREALDRRMNVLVDEFPSYRLIAPLAITHGDQVPECRDAACIKMLEDPDAASYLVLASGGNALIFLPGELSHIKEYFENLGIDYRAMIREAKLEGRSGTHVLGVGADPFPESIRMPYIDTLDAKLKREGLARRFVIWMNTSKAESADDAIMLTAFGLRFYEASTPYIKLEIRYGKDDERYLMSRNDEVLRATEEFLSLNPSLKILPMIGKGISREELSRLLIGDGSVEGRRQHKRVVALRVELSQPGSAVGFGSDQDLAQVERVVQWARELRPDLPLIAEAGIGHPDEAYKAIAERGFDLALVNANITRDDNPVYRSMQYRTAIENAVKTLPPQPSEMQKVSIYPQASVTISVPEFKTPEEKYSYINGMMRRISLLLTRHQGQGIRAFVKSDTLYGDGPVYHRFTRISQLEMALFSQKDVELVLTSENANSAILTELGQAISGAADLARESAPLGFADKLESLEDRQADEFAHFFVREVGEMQSSSLMQRVMRDSEAAGSASHFAPTLKRYLTGQITLIDAVSLLMPGAGVRERSEIASYLVSAKAIPVKSPDFYFPRVALRSYLARGERAAEYDFFFSSIQRDLHKPKEQIERLMRSAAFEYDEAVLVRFLARVYAVQNRWGQLMVGPILVDFKVQPGGAMHLYYGPEIASPAVVDASQWQLLQHDSDGVVMEAVTAQSHLKVVLERAYQKINDSLNAESFSRSKVVVVVNLESLGLATEGVAETALPLLLSEMQYSKNRDYGRKAKFLLQGSSWVLDTVRGMLPKGQFDIVTDQSELGPEYEDAAKAPRVTLTTPGYLESNESRHFFIQKPQAGDIPNFRAALKGALALGRIQKMESVDPDFLGYKEFVESMLGRPIDNVSEFIQSAVSPSGVDARRIHEYYALPALIRLPLNALVQGARLVQKMTLQAA